MEQENINEWDKPAFKMLEFHLRTINQESNTMNCIFSDGSYLFCYSDRAGYNGGLRFVRRSYPFGTVRLERNEQNLGKISVFVDLDEEKARDSTGYIVSTKELTSEDWKPLGNAHLLVLKEGSIVYP